MALFAVRGARPGRRPRGVVVVQHRLGSLATDRGCRGRRLLLVGTPQRRDLKDIATQVRVLHQLAQMCIDVGVINHECAAFVRGIEA